MGCVPESRLQQFAEGTLSPPAATAVEKHLDACDDCRELLAETARATLPEGGDTPDAPAGPPAPQESEQPLRSAGRYQFVRPIGAGGMGVVYEARDPRLGRLVAIKVWRGARSAEARALLLHEARAMARLSHPNVIAVHDVLEEGDQVCVAMELASGPTLQQWLKAAPRTWREVAGAFAQAARGLEAAHAAGLVHRDFKPDNALVSADGRVRVTDFGLSLPQAAPGSASGSPAYMAPEQLRGEPADARADVFSFCVALREALAGLGAPASLARALERGAAPDASERTSTLGEIRSTVEAALAARRNRAVAALLAIAALVVLALALITARQRHSIQELQARKVELDARIRETLLQMQSEARPERLRELEASLLHDEGSAESALEKLAQGGAAAAGGSDELQALLARFGAPTYVVPPLFRERVAFHAARIRASKDLPLARERMARWLPPARRELAARGLPMELAYVAYVESQFNPLARSPSGSVGLWQFQPATARTYGLVVDGQRDDRTDGEKSTRAAAAYLADQFADFGRDSFLLAIASYNCGEGLMRRVLHQLAQEPGGLDQGRRDFWHLYRRKLLPAETCEYVPAVMAAALVLEGH